MVTTKVWEESRGTAKDSVGVKNLEREKVYETDSSQLVLTS